MRTPHKSHNMKQFELISDYVPTGDQPEAIQQLTEGILQGVRAQTLLGVTGSGKTFTVANVIRNIGRPTLILSHNKTLAAQLYGEMKQFFPHNAVEYYVSYYDYYQPEAYMPATDTRQDVIVVSSVSCIYGMGNPSTFYESLLELHVGQELDRNELLRRLNELLYVRNDVSLTRGEYRVKGDTVDIALAYSDFLLRITFWGDEIESIEELDAELLVRIQLYDSYKVYPANLFMTSKDAQERAIVQIQEDLREQVAFFENQGKELEAKRLHERVTYDIEMIRELGHCAGIENYSRYFDGRKPGTRPYCLLDFFPKDFLLVVDESHVSVPQLHAMYGGDQARKTTLVEYGFRLPAAKDNRPLKFEEFQEMVHQVIYVSATPADFEIAESEGVVVEQVIRPTGLLDPPIEVRPTENQVDDLMEEIQQCIERKERALVVTLTKRMAEELTEYLLGTGIQAAYIHSDVDTLDRVRILNELRAGVYDVLVGINLLREGLDLPEVSLVAILDADKEGFLRNERTLTQTIGRAARNVNGKAIMYADSITESMAATINETNRRREKQLRYNAEHNITPQQIRKAATMGDLMQHSQASDTRAYVEPHYEVLAVAEPETLSVEEKKKRIASLKRKMEEAAKKMEFVDAAILRDEMLRLQAEIEE